LGGGLQIALGADFRFTTPDCKFSVMEAKWGLVPDMCGSVLLRELVSLDVAKELTYTARTVDGAEAARLGLATRACEAGGDPMEAARALAAEIAGRSPDAVAAAKTLLTTTWSMGTRDALKAETRLQERLLMPPLKNTLAAASQGLGLPVQLAFKDRQRDWKGTGE